MKDKPYNRLVARLIYLCITRGDISVPVLHLSRFLRFPKKGHWVKAMRVIGYLKKNPGLCLKYERGTTDGSQLKVWADSDFANNLKTRKSISGWALMLAGGPIICKSRSQATLATSTTAAEIIAQNEALRDCIWVRRFLNKLGIQQVGPTVQYCDNAAAVLVSKNNCCRHKVKHMDIKFMYYREQVNLGVITVEKVMGTKNRADLLTNNLVKGPFERGRDSLSIVQRTKYVPDWKCGYHQTYGHEQDSPRCCELRGVPWRGTR